MFYPLRSERWTCGDRTALVEVQQQGGLIEDEEQVEGREVVVVSYPLLTQMLTELGYVHEVDR